MQATQWCWQLKGHFDKEYTVLKIALVVAGLLLRFSPVVAADGSALNGYGSAEWGMTVNQVLASEKRAERTTPPTQYKNWTGEAHISAIDINQETFKADFLFDHSGRLAIVNVTPALEGSANSKQRLFKSLEELLTLKYGPPNFREPGKKADWKLGRTNLDLDFINAPGIACFLTLQYSPTSRMKSATDNL